MFQVRRCGDIATITCAAPLHVDACSRMSVLLTLELEMLVPKLFAFICFPLDYGTCDDRSTGEYSATGLDPKSMSDAFLIGRYQRS
jgi:hypothetical protein